MQRRQFFEIALAVPALAACNGDTTTSSDAAKRLAALRKVAIDQSIEPAMTFVPLRRK